MPRGQTRWCVSLAGVCLLLISLAAGQNQNPADTPTISALVAQIKALQEQERKLEQRIAFLEAKKSAGAASPPAITANSVAPMQDSSAPEPGQATASEDHRPPATAASVHASDFHEIEGIHWRGFGELDYKALNQRTPETGTYGFVPGSAGNFYIGDFDLFLSSRLNDRTSVLAEPDFQETDAQAFKVDLRRMLLNYEVNDHFKFSLGRYQTYIGYYNWAFRSAGWLQTTVDRPLVMEFASDGGILPTQAIGVSLTGTIPSGRLGLNYVAEYGSSDTIRPDINGSGILNDENNGNHTNLGIFLTPDAVPGLRVGASVYRDQISDLISLASGGPVTGSASTGVPPATDRWNQTIVNAHAVYVGRGFEFLNEAFLIRFAPTGGGAIFNTPAFYSQVSKSVGPLRPFLRFQYVNASPRNALYDDVRLRYGPSFGARYDPNQFLAFKVQLDQTMRRGLANLDGLQFQIAGTF